MAPSSTAAPPSTATSTRNSASTPPTAPPPPEAYFNRGIHVEQSYTVNKDPMELYRFWRDFENLPKFMDHLQSVTKIDDRKSHWVVTAPAGVR